MGQFEKIVVLTVLSLIAVILVISFSGGDDPLTDPDGGSSAVVQAGGGEDAGRRDPRPIPGINGSSVDSNGLRVDSNGLRVDSNGLRVDSKGLRVDSNGPSAPAPGELELAGAVRGGDPGGSFGSRQTGGGVAAGSRAPDLRGAERVGSTGLMLDAALGERPVEAPEPLAEELPEGAALITLSGLDATWEDDLKQYEWMRGDTFERVAQRFYGDRSMAALLRQYNEGMERVEAGETVLVPVFDRRATEVARVSAANVHVVQDGESLWTIAKKAYGRGSDWNRIYEANRDTLASPDALQAGMRLRIP